MSIHMTTSANCHIHTLNCILQRDRERDSARERQKVFVSRRCHNVDDDGQKIMLHLKSNIKGGLKNWHIFVRLVRGLV